MDVTLKTALALVPVPLFYLIYRRYFLFDPRASKNLEFFLAGVGIAAFVLLLHLFLPERPLGGAAFTAFFRAALLEKLPAFGFLLFSLRRGRLFSLVDAGASGVLLGLGFSFLENIAYSFESDAILARLFTAVPIHATTCGILAYCLGLARLRDTRGGRLNSAGGFLIAWALHGLFDWALLRGASATYWAGPALLLPLFLLDYLMARARTVPPLEILEALELRYEDWLILQKQTQYERWILQSMGSGPASYSPLLLWQRGPRRVAGILFAVGTATLGLSFGSAIARTGIGVRPAEVETFLVLVPVLLAGNLVVVGLFNPDYFRNSIIRIPVVSDVEIVSGARSQRSITYDLNARGCFLKTIEGYHPGETLELVLHHQGSASPPFVGRVAWDNHRNIRQQFGTMLAFGPLGAPQRSFLRRYAFFKFLRGVAFQLKLPGFELIRRLFLRPESVMQDERFFPVGTVLFREGDPGSDFFMVRRGSVQIYRETSAGTRTVLGRLGPGQIFGEMAIAAAQPRNASAICETDVVLAVASGDDLMAMIRSNPDFAREVIRTSSERIHRSTAAFDENLRAMERELEGRRAHARAALLIAAAGMGARVQDGGVEPVLDLERARACLGVQPEESVAILRSLFGAPNSAPQAGQPDRGPSRPHSETIARLASGYRLRLQGRRPKENPPA